MIFPLGDDNPTRRVPVMTWLLIGMNAAVFVAFNLKMDETELRQWTANWGYDVDHPFAKQLFSSMFMHGGWWHILGNMWVLWIVGDNVEDKVGKLGYLALYLFGGCAAALTFAGIAASVGGEDPGAMDIYGRPHVPLVGASGAIAAIMGMYLVFFPEARIRLLVWFLFFVQIILVRAKWFIGLTLAIDLVASGMAHGASSGGVATMAHVGGGAFGVVAALVLKPMVGGGGEGDAWDVHTGFAKRMRAGAEPWQETRLPPGPSMSPYETDESSIRDVERSITQLVRAGRVREAIDVYPAYVAMAREQPLPDDVQIEIAHELYRQWLPKEAIPAYLRYLDTHPSGDDVAEAKFRLGVLYARGVGRRDDASKWLREAAREHHDPQIRAAAAQMLAQMGG